MLKNVHVGAKEKTRHCEYCPSDDAVTLELFCVKCLDKQYTYIYKPADLVVKDFEAFAKKHKHRKHVQRTKSTKTR